MTTKLKIRAYAIFQFISFLALIMILVAGVLIGYSVITEQNGNQSSLTAGATWAKNIVSTLRFEKIETIGIFASLMTYLSLTTFILSWISGWMIFRVNNRNLFDSLFLLFLCLPIISNIFALFAQVATKEITFSSSKIDKKEVIAEQTKILQLEHRKEKRREQLLIKKRKEAAKIKAEATKMEQERLARTEAKQVAKLEVSKVQTKKVTKKATPKKTVVKKPTAKKSAKKPVAKKSTSK